MISKDLASLPAPWIKRPGCTLQLPSGDQLDVDSRPLVMGILNVTPDSFSDGGRYFRPDMAVRRARNMEADGADIIDIGGESTRPGSKPVSEEEEIDRVIPVIRELAAESTAPISIDTQKAAVAREALRKGAQIINDVSGMRADPEMPEVAAETDALACLMHMQGRPRNMQDNPIYEDVVDDINKWLQRRIACAVDSGISRNRIIVDPGFGFGKRVEHNLEIMRRLHEFHQTGCPVMIGTSRKSTIGTVLDADTSERLYGTLATVATATMSGGHIVRVHDPAPALDTIRMCEAIRQGMEWQG